MREINFLTSACRYCRFYKPEGRRGGTCNRLEVPVQSSWKACSLAAPPFSYTLKKIKKIMLLNSSSSTDKAIESNQYSIVSQ